MGASPTERCRVGDEGLRVVKLCGGGESREADLSLEEARAKFVPAAAVRRTVRTLFGITGLKARVGGSARPIAESPRLNRGRGGDTAGLAGGRGTWNFRWSGEMR